MARKLIVYAQRTPLGNRVNVFVETPTGGWESLSLGLGEATKLVEDIKAKVEDLKHREGFASGWSDDQRRAYWDKYYADNDPTQIVNQKRMAKEREELRTIADEIVVRSMQFNNGQHGRFYSTGEELIDLGGAMSPLKLGNGRNVELSDTPFPKSQFTKAEAVHLVLVSIALVAMVAGVIYLFQHTVK